VRDQLASHLKLIGLTSKITANMVLDLLPTPRQANTQFTEM
jgi:hypothetical protein